MQATRVIGVLDERQEAGHELVRLVTALGHPARMFASLTEVMACAPDTRPRCLVVGVGPADVAALDLPQRLRSAGAGIPVVFVGHDADIRMAVHAMQAGAIDFLPSPPRALDLARALEIALTDDALREGEAARQSHAQALYARLTPRETEVFLHVLAGKRNKEIAAILDSREATIKVHRSRLMRKLGSRSLGELLQFGRLIEQRADARAAKSPSPDRSRPDARACLAANDPSLYIAVTPAVAHDGFATTKPVRRAPRPRLLDRAT